MVVRAIGSLVAAVIALHPDPLAFPAHAFTPARIQPTMTSTVTPCLVAESEVAPARPEPAPRPHTGEYLAMGCFALIVLTVLFAILLL